MQVADKPATQIMSTTLFSFYFIVILLAFPPLTKKCPFIISFWCEIIMNTRTLTLSLWSLLKDWAGRSRDSRSHHGRLTVDGDVAYHWKHSAVKSWNKSRKIRAIMPSRGLEPEWTGSTTKNPTNRSLDVKLFMWIYQYKSNISIQKYLLHIHKFLKTHTERVVIRII